VELLYLDCQRGYAACKFVPEFKFSEKHITEHIPFIAYNDWNGSDQTPMGPPVPPMISNPRTLHPKYQVPAIEEGWRNLQPFFKTPIKQTGFVQPLNSLKGMDHFLSRIQTLNRMIHQQERDALTSLILIEQDKELATIADEFKANGFKAISLSSSQEDDDLPAANFAESHMRYVPYKYDPETLAPLLRRIDWERYALACGQPQRVWLTAKADGTITATTDNKVLTPDEIRALARKIKDACNFQDAREMKNSRARAVHYGVVGSILYGKRKGAQWPEQSMDILGAEDMELKRRAGNSPQGIGFHELPSDDELEPVSPGEEFALELNWLSDE
jgi:hypothetical protein